MALMTTSVVKAFGAIGIQLAVDPTGSALTITTAQQVWDLIVGRLTPDEQAEAGRFVEGLAKALEEEVRRSALDEQQVEALLDRTRLLLQRYSFGRFDLAAWNGNAAQAATAILRRADQDLPMLQDNQNQWCERFIGEYLSRLQAVSGLLLTAEQRFRAELGRKDLELRTRVAALESWLDAVAECEILTTNRSRLDLGTYREIGPSHLLRAEFEIVPFAGREVEQQGLHRWCDDGPRIDLHVVLGAGGMGKTRLLQKVAADLRCQSEPWRAGFLRRDTPPDTIERALRAFARKDDRILIVIDYAEADVASVQATVRTLNDLVTHHSRKRARIVLLARGRGEWLDTLAGSGDMTKLFPTGTIPEASITELAPLYQDTAARTDLGLVARDLFANYLPDYPTAPLPPLDKELFGSALYVLLAAYAAAEGHTIAGGPDLLAFVVNRELDYWRRCTGIDAREPVRMLEEPGALVTLMGEVARPDAGRLFRGFERLMASGRAAVLADVLQHLYPVPESAGVFTGMKPDILGEHLVRRVTERYGLSGTLDQIYGEHGELAQRRHAALVLARIEDAGGGVLDSLASDLARHPEGFLVAAINQAAQSSPAMARFVTTFWGRVGTYNLARVVERHLPRPSIALGRLSADVLQTMHAHIMTIDTADTAILIEQARIANKLAISLRDVGQRAGALAPARKAVEIHRRLVADNPGNSSAHVLTLTSSLDNLAGTLSEIGLHAEALAPAQENVEFYRRLAVDLPDACAPLLAGALSTLAIILGEVGRHAEALVPAQEAAALYHRLADDDPEEYTSYLANAIHILAIRLSAVGRHAEALNPAQEAAELYRRLAGDNPDVHAPSLPLALNTLAISLSKVGRHAEALAPTQEAAELYRRLAGHNPDAYDPDLAMSLNTLAVTFSEVGLHAEALAPAQETAELYRRLAGDNPGAYAPAFAMALYNLVLRLSAVGRRAEALAPAQEVAEIYRRLAVDNPGRHTPSLAMALNALAVTLSAVRRRTDALAPAQEAAELYRRLAVDDPGGFTPALANALNNLADRMSEVGRHAEALTPAQEAAELYRRLESDNPGGYSPALANVLNNLANKLSKVGRHAEALAPGQETAELYRRLAAGNPGAHAFDLATALFTLAASLSEVGRHAEALAPTQEAAELYRRLAVNSHAYAPLLADALYTLAVTLSKVGRHSEALAPAQEAAELYRRLAGDYPDTYASILADALKTLANCLRVDGSAAAIEQRAQSLGFARPPRGYDTKVIITYRGVRL